MSKHLEKILERAVYDEAFRNKLNSQIEYAIQQIDRGVSVPDSVVSEFARARIRVRKKYSKWDKLFFDKYSAMYSTPENIGRYRASRINGPVLDVGSGAGMQCIMFGLEYGCKGIEVDRSRYLMSLLNSIAYRCKSEFVNSDFYKNSIRDAHIVFSDPLRTKASSISELKPSPLDIMEKIQAEAFIFDLPPRMPASTINIDGEREYISVDGVLSRFTVYTGSLKEAEYSAHIMPSGIHLNGEKQTVKFEEGVPGRLIYVPDPAVVAAGLLGAYSSLVMVSNDGRRLILSSDDTVENFPGTIYEIIHSCDGTSLAFSLRSLRPRNVYLRFSIDPVQYYSITNSVTSADGLTDLYVFRYKELFLITKKIFDINSTGNKAVNFFK